MRVLYSTCTDSHGNASMVGEVHHNSVALDIPVSADHKSEAFY